MRRIRIDIADGLKFTKRLYDRELKLNISMQSSAGAVLNARQDAVVLTLPNAPKRIARWQGRVYTMTEAGQLFSGTTLLEGSFGDSSFSIQSSRPLPYVPFLFIAGGTKMRKVSATDGVTNWGIAPPPVDPLVASSGGGSGTPIHARYAYQYYNSTTEQVSNRNFNPSNLFDSAGANVLVTGLIGSSDPQVTHIRILRDTIGDGNFRFVALRTNTSGSYIDSTLTADLGDSDTNDNAPPPGAANLIAYWRGSLWVNDFSVRRRLWASVPGRLESFPIAGLYYLGEDNDEIRAMGVVAGNLYIWTQNKIFLASGEWPLFTFDAIADFGVVSSYAFTSDRDRAVFASNAGIWEFDGATIKPLPEIWTLFDPNSTDSRRFIGQDVNNFVIGADDRFVWAGWQLLSGIRLTWEYESFRNIWTERGPLSAFDNNHDSPFQHAGDYSGQVVEISKGERGPFILASPEVELDFSRMLYFELDYKGGPFEFSGLVDGITHVNETVPFAPSRRRFTVPLPDNIFGRQVSFACVQSDMGETGLVDVYIFTDELPVPVRIHDTGEQLLSHNKAMSNDLIVHLIAERALEIDGQLYIDGFPVFSFTLETAGVGVIGPERFVIPSHDGRSARVVLKGTDLFSVLNISLGATMLGDEAIKRVELGGEYIPVTRRQQRNITPLG